MIICMKVSTVAMDIHINREYINKPIFLNINKRLMHIKGIITIILASAFNFCLCQDNVDIIRINIPDTTNIYLSDIIKSIDVVRGAIDDDNSVAQTQQAETFNSVLRNGTPTFRRPPYGIGSIYSDVVKERNIYSCTYFDNRVLFHFVPSDTIYCFKPSDGSLEPLFALDFCGTGFPDTLSSWNSRYYDKYVKSHSGYAGLAGNVKKFGNVLYLTYMYSNKEYQLLYNTKNGHVLTGIIVDDIFRKGSRLFWDTTFNRRENHLRDGFVTVTSPTLFNIPGLSYKEEGPVQLHIIFKDF